MGGALALLLIASAAAAHVGSPHVYTERTVAGHDLFAVVHLPPAIPGEAEVQVRLQDHDPSVPVTLRVREIPPVGDEYAPPAAEMKRDDADPAFFTAPMSLMGRGLWKAEIQLEGPEGRGSFRLEVPARSPRPPAMEAGRAAILVALSLLIFASLWTILSGLGRRGTLPAGREVEPRDVRRGRIFAIVGCLLFAGLYGGILWLWSAFDTALRASARDPVTAEVRALGPPPVAGSHRAFNVVLAADGRPLANVATEPDGSLHAVAVAADLSWIRPFTTEPARPGVHRFELDFVESGLHRLYVDYRRADGDATVVHELDVIPGSEGSATGESVGLSAPSAGELVGRREWPLGDGGALRWIAPEEAPEVGELATLEFELVAPEGEATIDRSAASETELVVLRDDGEVYVRLEPTRTADAPNRVRFPYGFPRKGTYRLFLQVRSDDEVHRGAFDVLIR